MSSLPLSFRNFPRPRVAGRPSRADPVTPRGSPHAIGDRALKVNHAGENGAVNIYRGQAWIARWRDPSIISDLQLLQGHEETHREIFRVELQHRNKRRCRSYHLCGAGGLALGVLTGLCGRRAVAATTAAVERVVLRHLSAQLRQLTNSDPAAARAVLSIIDDERSHLEHGESGSTRFWGRVLAPVVAIATETVIWIGMRI